MRIQNCITAVLGCIVSAGILSYAQSPPAVVQLTSSPEEQDYPAIAQSGDRVYVSYVEFVHGDPAQENAPEIHMKLPATSIFCRGPSAAIRSSS